MEPAPRDQPGQGQTQGRYAAPWLAIGLVALVASISSLGNGFAYDDIHAIVRNDRIHSLASPWQFFTHTYWPPGKYVGGSTLYRPLSSLGFALQWAIGSGSPLVFHITNLMLYLAGCLAVFWFLTLLLPLRAAWIAAALFAAHPVHVEAVANCVGQGELWVALFAVLAAGLFVRRVVARWETGPVTRFTPVRTACLAKDNIQFSQAC